MQKSQLRWQCRRGMRELDELLTAYVESRYDAAPDAEKTAFHAFLQLSDPELVAYLLKREQPSSGAIAGVVTRILSRTQT